MTVLAPAPGLLPGTDLARVLTGPLALLERQVGLDLWLVTRREGAHLRVLAASGAGTLQGRTIPWQDTISARMLRGEGPRCAPRCSAVPAYATAPVRRRLGIQAYLGAPLREPTNQVVLGSLCGIAATEQPDSLALALPLVEQLAELLGVVLAQHDAVQGWRAVADLAERDAVTGLLNRRGWDRALAVEEARGNRSSLATGVLVIDLDEFKRVNDTLGHAAGDTRLQAAARAISGACRPEDVVSRVGGDEFAVLAADCAADHLQGLSRRVSGSLAWSGVRASVGAASRRPGEELRATWERADADMYAVKRTRRRGTAHPPQADAPRPVLVLVPPIRSPLHAGGAGPAPRPSSSIAVRRTLIVALHRAGGLTADELVNLQLSDVIEHPSGLVVQATGPWPASGGARRFGLGRQAGDDCPVQAFESWQDLLERAFRAERGRAMQPADRHGQPLFCALGRGGRPTRSRLSAQAVAHVMRTASPRTVGGPTPASLDASNLRVGWSGSGSAGGGRS